MPYYGQDFQVFPAGVNPTKANVWYTLDEVMEQYEEFCIDCERFDQTPLPHWLYIGEPGGNEERYGYPDYPDYIISIGKDMVVQITQTIQSLRK